MRIIRLVVAALLAGAATTVAASPARAAACASGTGVTVVVNSGVRCDADGGGVAWSNFTDAGHSLEGTRRFPNFVCRVDGSPGTDEEACINTPPADAYWGLFWSDGTSGKWVYSNLGATSLKVPKGGSVALVFQSSDSRTWPSVTPPVAGTKPTKSTSTTAAPTAKPSATKSTTKPTSKPSGSAATSASTGATASPSASPSTSASATPSTSPTSPGASASGPDADATNASGDAVDATLTAADSDDDGFPAGLVVGVVVVALVAAAAAAQAARRRRG